LLAIRKHTPSTSRRRTEHINPNKMSQHRWQSTRTLHTLPRRNIIYHTRLHSRRDHLNRHSLQLRKMDRNRHYLRSPTYLAWLMESDRARSMVSLSGRLDCFNEANSIAVARQSHQTEVQAPMHHQHPQAQPQIPHQHHQYRPNLGTLDSRQQVAAYPQQEFNSSQRTMLPPSPPPPMRSDSIGESTHSPSTVSTGSSLSAQPYYVGSSLNNIEADNQRAVVAHMAKRPSVPSQANTSPYGASPYAHSAYSASPGGLSTGSFYSPTEPAYAVQGLYSQRPLPSNFPPTAAQSAPNLPTTNPWEHHHYISPSSQSNYPQSQDRYICQTCNKAFSRPSSLKIHSHSHTGEKPFKCPHAGCGKSFSVRSNMKRHERGCHTGNGGVMT